MSKLKKKSEMLRSSKLTHHRQASDENPLSAQPMEVSKGDFIVEDDMPLKHLVQKAHLMFLLYGKMNRFRSSSAPLDYRPEY